MEVRWKILAGAVAVGVVAATVVLWRTEPAPQPAESAQAAQSSPPPPSARAPGTELKLPGSWVDQVPPGAAANGPLIIGLHGRGDTASNFSGVGAKLGPQWAWRFLEAPLPWRENTQWFRMDAPDGGRAELQSAAALVDAHVKSARGRKVALVGFSQGCFLAAHYAATHPESIQAALCIGGGLAVPPEVPPAAHKPAILFVHGTADTVIPPSRAREAKQTLENRGLPCELWEHNEGHTIPESEIARMRAWLESKVR